MKKYYLSKKMLANLALPGEYLFSLVKEKARGAKLLSAPVFPGKTTQRFICSYSCKHSHLIFFLSHSSRSPVLHWLLKVHRRADGRYVVIGDRTFEEVLIQGGSIVQASVQALPQALPLPANYDNAIQLYIKDPPPESRELHSLISSTKPVPWKKDHPGIRVYDRLPAPTLLTLGILFLLLFTSAFLLKNDPEENFNEQPLPTVLPQQNYMSAESISSRIKIIYSQLPEHVWINKIDIDNEAVDIQLRGENIQGFLQSFEEDFEISAENINLTQILQSQPELQLRISRISEQSENTAVASDTVVGALELPYLIEGIQEVTALRQNLEDMTGRAVEIGENNGLLRISIILSPEKSIVALKTLAENSLPILGFSLERHSDYELFMSIIIQFEDMQKKEGNYFVRTASESDEEIQVILQAEEIQRIFDLNIRRSLPVPTVQSESFVPNYLEPQGTIVLAGRQYFSFYNSLNGFTICLSPGENYGTWYLTEFGGFISLNKAH